MDADKILADAIKEFQKTMEVAQKKMMDDFQNILKKATKDAEAKLNKKEEAELSSLDDEIANF